MKAEEVRGKENSEIEFDLEQVEKQYFEMRFRSLTEGNTDPAKMGHLRKDLARMKTILRERELEVRGQQPR